MGFIARIKTWGAEKLLFSDLNAEFNAIINGLRGGTEDVNVASCNVNSTLRAKGAAQLGSSSTDTVSVLGTLAVEAPIDAPNVTLNVGNVEAVNITVSDSVVWGGSVPIGSIIPHYDFNGALPVDANYWAYCNGQTLNVGDQINQVLPDLSGRYLVGFGGATDGAGDIDSASWATTVVGQELHTSASIAHTHTVNAHTHAPGTLQFRTLAVTGVGTTRNFLRYQSNGAVSSMFSLSGSGAASGTTTEGVTLISAGTSDIGYTANGAGVTHTANTDGTTSNLTTISVQPRSVRVRYVMRVK